MGDIEDNPIAVYRFEQYLQSVRQTASMEARNKKGSLQLPNLYDILWGE